MDSLKHQWNPESLSLEKTYFVEVFLSVWVHFGYISPSQWWPQHQKDRFDGKPFWPTTPCCCLSLLVPPDKKLLELKMFILLGPQPISCTWVRWRLTENHWNLDLSPSLARQDRHSTERVMSDKNVSLQKKIFSTKEKAFLEFFNEKKNVIKQNDLGSK